MNRPDADPSRPDKPGDRSRDPNRDADRGAAGSAGQGSGNSPSGHSPSGNPPPGSKGYRAQGDPLPRGIPIAGPSRPARPTQPSSSASGSSPSKPTPPASPPRPTRPSQPPTPQPLRQPASVSSASVLGSPKVPVAGASPSTPDQTPPPPPPPAAPSDASDGSGAGGSYSGRSFTDRRGLFLVLAVLVSLGLHGFLAWEFYDRPLSYIDPSLMGEERELFRVKRAQRDFIIEENTGPSLSPAQPRQPQSPLADLSIALLNTSAANTPQPSQSALDQPPDVQPAPKPFEDTRPSQAASPAPAGAPAIDLPQSIRSQMVMDIPLATRFVGQGGAGPPDAQGSNLADLGGSGGDGSGEASALLSQGARAAAAIPTPSQLAPPTLSDRAALPEQRPTGKDLIPQPVDLSSITADAATRLSIPEHLDNDFDYAVSKFLPKGGWGVSEEDQRGYFRVDITAKRSLRKLQTMPKDTVYIIDISGSVSQMWVNAILAGVRDSLASLNPEDRFNIVFFSDKPAVLGADAILPVNEENLAKAREFLASAKSGGETDVNQAMSRLLVRDVAVDRSYQLVLISDGRPTRGVMNTRELINLITRDNDLAASIYCVGVGDTQNRTLLEFLAYRNKGFCVYAENHFQAPMLIRDLASRLRYPIMKDIRLAVLGLNIDEVFPSDLPTIHQGETFSIFGRFDPPGKDFTMRLIGHNGKQMFDFTFTRDLAQSPLGEEQISRDWGFWKLHHLYNQMIRQGDTRELRSAIEYLRRKYKLQTLYNN